MLRISIFDGLLINTTRSEEDRAYVYSSCHRDVPTWAYIEDAHVVIECAECEKELIRFRFEGEKR